MNTTSFIVNAGAHIVEPGDLFTAGQDDQLTAWSPNSVETGEGTLYRLGERQVSHTAVRPDCGPFTATGHLERMAAAGIDAEVVLPSLGLLVSRVGHPDAARQASARYNEWILDAVAGLRHTLVPVAVLPMTRVSQATDALTAVIDHGFSAVVMPCALLDTCEELTDPAWDGFFSRAGEAGVTLVFHTAAGNVNHRPARGGNSALAASARQTGDAISSLTALVGGGLLDRHRACRVVFAGGGAGWLPGVCERLDHAYVASRPSNGPLLSRQPSEIVRDQVSCLFEHETAFASNLEQLPASCFLFAAGQSVDGFARRSLDVVAAHTTLDAATRAALLGGNAASLFGTSPAAVYAEREARDLLPAP